MQWYRTIGWSEVIFLLAFVAFYLLYIRRIIIASRVLQVSLTQIVLKLVLRTVYFLLFLVALLGPSFGGATREVQAVGKDIMICIDLSRSMDAFDVQPTRLEKIKFELKKIVEAFSTDRIGIIIFSNEAFMQCPLTFDQNALYLFIETINTNLVPTGGTDFGPPLRMALKKLTEEQASDRSNSSKVIVLISDGEDFGGNTAEVVEQIDKADIKVFTLGIGTTGGGNILTANGLKRDKNGKIILTRLESSSLRDLAKNTGGSYFEISGTTNEVSRLINAINNIEGEIRDARFIDVTANEYFYFLLAGFLLFLIDVLVPVPALRL